MQTPMAILTCQCRADQIDDGVIAAHCPQCGRPRQAPPLTLWARWKQQSAGLTISAVVHGVLLLILGLWILPSVTAPEGLDVLLSTTEGEADRDLPVDFHAAVDFTSKTTAATSQQAATSAALSSALAPSGTLPASSRIDPTRIEYRPQSPNNIPQLQTPADLSHAIRPLRRSDPQAGGLVQQASVTGALNGVLGHIRGESQQDMLQVVWLLDASISLHTDRQEIATQLVPFYKEMISRPDKREKPFRSVVVGYGDRPIIIQRSTDNAARVVQAIAGMSADPSGLEHVFTAIQFAMKSFGEWKGTTVIVLWTDESGDDLAKLEETIRLCREHRTIVHVVGPQAVLGMEQGLQSYVVPQTNQAFLLPVKRGPDAALPERLRLPYWFDSTSPPWSQNGAYISSQGAVSYGGPLREGVLSGTGPYALTRLALETGGTFTLLQRQGDAQPLAWERQRMYLPDYHEVREIVSDVRRHPIRQAIVEAAALTWQADLQPPVRMFYGQAMDRYPFAARVIYLPAEIFQTRLKADCVGFMRRCEQDQAVVEAALAVLDPFRLETAYESEESPRWQAWYDLNLGRLLAMSVRLAEYRETLRLVREGVGLSRETNSLTLIESSQLKTGRVAEERATQAKAHLQTVLTDHPGTPWARLAQWELEHALGFIAQPGTVPIPQPGPVSIKPAGGALKLPNL